MLALPQEVLARPGLADRVMNVAGVGDAAAPPGPSRDQLLSMLAG